jgi:hypothetical protein
MIVECPHCHTRVLPKSGDICPACGSATKHTADTVTTDTTLAVRPGMAFPPICIVCGKEQSRYHTITRRQYVASDSSNRDSSLGMGLLLGVFGLLLRLPFLRSARSVAVEVPICRECEKFAKDRLRYVNFEESTMTLIVHRNVTEGLSRRGVSS